MEILKAVLFALLLVSGIGVLIIGLFILFGGAGYVFWQALLYGLLTIGGGAFLVWLAGKALGD